MPGGASVQTPAPVILQVTGIGVVCLVALRCQAEEEHEILDAQTRETLAGFLIQGRIDELAFLVLQGADSILDSRRHQHTVNMDLTFLLLHRK